MIDINVINQYDHHSNYETIIKDIIEIGDTYLNLNKDYIINFILVEDDYIKNLNHQFRNINKATDVLSFENHDLDEELGDVFISIDKVKTQSMAYEHSFERELAFLTLHGFLHCLGYDHQNLGAEKEMFALQKEIMNQSKYSR